MKYALIFNTNRVGGAERSMVFQFPYHKNTTCFIPKIDDSKELESFLLEQGFSSIKYFDFPSGLYLASRDRLGFFRIALGCFHLLSPRAFSFWTKVFRDHDIFYCNGNKAMFILAWYFRWHKESKIFFWHVRDYASALFKSFLWNWLLPQGTKIVANSLSTAKSFEGITKESPYIVYNPIGDLAFQERQSFKRIGVVAMDAPWKGAHDIIWFWYLFRKELKAIGVMELRLYGRSIYKTSGQHKGYFEQLKFLVDKLGMDDCHFIRDKSPQEIFSEIDILFHSSLKEEPFGRVIVEAFQSGTLVFSTSLGGSSELIRDKDNAYRYEPKDFAGLYDDLYSAITNPDNSIEKVLRAQKFVTNWDTKIHKRMEEILNGKTSTES